MNTFTNRTRVALLCALHVAAAHAAAPTAATPAEIPAEAFFAREDMYRPAMSPSGDALAILVKNTAGRRQLAILDTADFTKVKVLNGFVDADVANVRWVDNQRLIYEAWDELESAYMMRRVVTMAIDRDGQHPMHIGGSGAILETERWTRDWMGQFVRVLNDGTGDVVSAWWEHTHVMGYGSRWLDSTPRRYDTRRAKASDIFPGRVPHGIQSWLFDEQGKARGGISYTGQDTVLFAPDDKGEWVERARFNTWNAPAAERFRVRFLATDGKLYVDHSPGGSDGADGLYRLDLDTGKIDPAPVVSAKGFDIEPAIIEDLKRHRVLGVRYHTDAEGTVWFDDEMKALQAKVDAKLPGRVNRLDAAACGCAKRLLVTSYSDRQPALFYLYDRGDDSLQAIGVSRPLIDARLAAITDFVRIKARDGHEVPVYVTKPQGKGPWPAVVLVHGGPFMRGWSWEWDAESQFLASRGYLVVKPEFRGSDGYGDVLRESGRRQWGLKMQDDIADATTWAAKEGLADADRTCIAGASYGGYATLMGLVRYPELYRCGVAWSAVSDLTLMHDLYWSDMSEDFRAYGMPLLIGDPEKDAAQFAATSPLQLAARITRPLLLAHGGIDRRVPIEQAVKMRDALQAAHAPLTWIEYKDEAHGWYKPETRVAFYERMAAFLADNIGPAAAAKTAAK